MFSSLFEQDKATARKRRVAASTEEDTGDSAFLDEVCDAERSEIYLGTKVGEETQT